MAVAQDAPKPRRHAVMAVVCIALLMASVDQTSVATALPALQEDFGAPMVWSAWVITVYALGQIVAMPLAGRLSDQFGRKCIFLWAVALFTVASLLCSLAPNIHALIALRAVQALGGGAFMPAAVGIVSDLYGRNRDKAIGLFTSVFPVGGLIGPLVGGLLVTAWSWRGIFVVNVPLGVAVLALGLWLLPRSQSRRAQRLDLLGLTLAVLGLLGAMIGVSNLGTTGVTLLGFIVPIAMGGACLAAFIWRSAVVEEPFVPLRLLAGREFAVMNVMNVFSGAATIGFGALMALYTVERYGMSVLGAGAMLTARAIGTMAVAGVAALAIRRTGYRWPLRIGYFLTGIGFIGVATAPPHGVADWAWLGGVALIIGVGMGISIPSNNNAGLDLAPRDIAAIAGVRGMARQIGGILGVSIVAAVAAGTGDSAMTQAVAFLVFGGIMIVLVPFASLVPQRLTLLA